MKNAVVRLSEIQIENFKNVKKGKLSFENKRKDYKASILGLYGQNGSGKTALIDALNILKVAMCGAKIPYEYADYINVEAEYSKLIYHFHIDTESFEKYEIYYELCLRAVEAEVDQNIDTMDEEEHPEHKVEIFNEILSYSYSNDEIKIRKGALIDTTSGVFVPVRKYELFFGKDKDLGQKLQLVKAMTAASSRSFIFSRELINEIRKQENEDTEYKFHKNILERMIYYANYELFIIGTADAGLISMNAQPLAFKYHHGDKNTVGKLMIPIDRAIKVPNDVYEIVSDVVENMNIVLRQIVPNLTISVEDLGAIVLKNGSKGHSIQLVSHKNSKPIPLRYESEGIKKIISILQLFIEIYNFPSITVAIDEIDSGIFEYLLGELMRIISEKGKGQLIFTSHNLRPLETIDRGFIAFTTTNPENRYIRLSKIKDNNNLRDFYFRDIVLGEQNEEVYEITNNSEIAFAFREAGESCGS